MPRTKIEREQQRMPKQLVTAFVVAENLRLTFPLNIK